MVPEEASQFMHDRLHRRNPHRSRPLVAHPTQRPSRVTRRVAMRLDDRATEVIPHADDSVLVCCTEGSIWITHDGDPKDVILAPGQTYRAEREDTMHLFALQPSLLEIQFDDDADPIVPV